MSDCTDLDHAVKGEIEDVACTEAVADSGERGDAAGLQTVDDLVQQWACLSLGMGREPGAEIKLYHNNGNFNHACNPY